MSREFLRLTPLELDVMRRELTTISALSMMIAFVAGLVLCMQVANTETQVGWDISAPVLWGVEVAIFGSAAYAWCSAISLGGWLSGIAGLVLVRLALTTGAALALAVTVSDKSLAGALQETSALAPRMCGVLFAVMVFYPLRAFLPVRPASTGRGRRFAESAAVKSAMGAAPGSDSELMIWAGSDQDTRAEARGGRTPRSMLDGSRPAVRLEGAVELPVPVVLAQLPADLVTDRAQRIDDKLTMSIPLDAVLPQLKEARVAFSAVQIREWLPESARKALVELEDGDGEVDLVVLPLALIVPQLPPEALVLPPPSPPAWATADQSERIVFARVERGVGQE